MEIWKDIKNYEGYYKVSDRGRVMAMDRFIMHRGIKSFRAGRLLKPSRPKTGYYGIRLCKCGLVSSFLIHRLVGRAFILNPNNKKCINHLDGNKINNNVKNLEWATYSENEIHSYNVLGKKHSMKGRYGKDSNRSIPVLQISKDNEFIREFDSISDAAKVIAISPSNISMVCTGKNKTAAGYKWKHKNL